MLMSAEGRDQRLDNVIDEILAQRCETQSIEIKAAANGTPKLYDTLSSFANQSGGGTIVLGIDESAGYRIVGVFDAQQAQRGIADQCKEMEPELHPTFETVRRDGKVLVGVTIDGLPMGMRPCFRKTAGISKGSYVRVGDQDVHMTQPELYAIESFKDGIRGDVAVSPIAEDAMLDPDRKAEFIRLAKADRPRLVHRGDDEVLTLTGVKREGKPTLAGLMCLGDYPQQVYPNLCMTAIAVAGTQIRQGEDGTRFLDSKRFEGTVDQIIDDALAFVRRNTKTRVVIRNGQRIDIPEYPENAVREVITNSLMHRDYGPYNEGTPNRLVIYSDRLECWNPGGIYGGQSVDELGHENIPTRNPTLVSLLEILRTAENRHSGIPVIRDEMHAAGLRPPVFVDARDTFVVRLYNEPESLDEQQKPKSSEESTKAGRRPGKTSAEDTVAFCTVPRSRREVAEHLGRTVAYVTRAFLNPLTESGQLVRTLPEKPRSKDQRYVARRA